MLKSFVRCLRVEVVGVVWADASGHVLDAYGKR